MELLKHGCSVTILDNEVGRAFNVCTTLQKLHFNSSTEHYSDAILKRIYTTIALLLSLLGTKCRGGHRKGPSTWLCNGRKKKQVCMQVCSSTDCRVLLLSITCLVAPKNGAPVIYILLLLVII